MENTAKKPRTPLDRDAWVAGAIEVLAEEGIAGLRVEVLAKRLKVTKGSFYWHFPSRDALLQAALDRWEQVELDELFAQLESIADPRQRMRELFLRVAHEVRSHVIYS